MRYIIIKANNSINRLNRRNNTTKYEINELKDEI